MPNLLVRNVEQSVVDELKARSGRRGVSAEEEHRRILREALLRPQKKSFEQVLSEMPDVGEDEDFERVQGQVERDVFD